MSVLVRCRGRSRHAVDLGQRLMTTGADARNLVRLNRGQVGKASTMLTADSVGTTRVSRIPLCREAHDTPVPSAPALP